MMLAVINNLAQPTIVWQESLGKELFTLSWPAGMSARIDLINWCEKTQPIVVAPFPRLELYESGETQLSKQTSAYAFISHYSWQCVKCYQLL